MEAEEECSASHAERDHACSNLKALQDSLAEAKDTARNSRQIARGGADGGMKGLWSQAVAASSEQNQVRLGGQVDAYGY